MSTVIDTRVVGITKKCPLEVFRRFHRFAYFSELMPRTTDGKVIWDETITSVCDLERAAEAEYTALQNDWLEINMELPAEWIGPYQPDMLTAAARGAS